MSGKGAKRKNKARITGFPVVTFSIPSTFSLLLSVMIFTPCLFVFQEQLTTVM